MSKTSKLPKNKLITLIIILAIAFSLRIYNLQNRGLFLWDEGYYLLNAQFYRSVIFNIGRVVRDIVAKDADVNTFANTLEGWPIGSAKPLHGILIALCSLFTGLKDYNALFLSALLGVASVYLVFVLGKRFYNTNVGLFSAIILATSEYHVMYSRSALAEADCLFFLLLAIYFYYLSYRNHNSLSEMSASQVTSKADVQSGSSWRHLAFAGLFLGLAFACNYRAVLLSPLFLAFEIQPYLSSKKISMNAMLEIGKRMSLFGGILFLTLFLFEVPYLIFKIFKPLPEGIPSYFQMLFGNYTHTSIQHARQFHPHLLFFKIIWDLEGPLVFVLLFAGVFLMIRSFSRPNFIITSIFLFPFIIYSLLSRGDNPRAISITIPFIALISGRTVEGLSDLIKRRVSTKISVDFVAVILICLICLFGVINSFKLMTLESGYQDAIQFMKSEGNVKHYTTNTAISKFYAGRENAFYIHAVPIVPHSYLSDKLPVENLQQLYEYAQKEGIKYVLIDIAEHDPDINAELLKEFKEAHDPVFMVPNEAIKYKPFLMEGLHSREDLISRVVNDANSHWIRVYDLEP